MNAIRKATLAEISGLGIEEATEGRAKGVYEMFRAEPDEKHDDAWIDLIDTGGLSVNCKCLVIADNAAEAQQMIENCDPSASGCDETHLWLSTAKSVVNAGVGRIAMLETGRECRVHGRTRARASRTR